MGSSSGTCEIVEAEDELKSDQCCTGHHELMSGFGVGDKDHKLPVLKQKGKESLEDDINELFEAIAKNSSKGSFSSQEGTSPSRKNAFKRQITTGMPNSPRVGNSEPVSLKQALRDLCISKASEMAATKRLSKSSAPSRTSEAERIKSLYETVVVEAKNASSSKDDSKRLMFEKSHVSQDHQVPEMKSSNKSVQPSPQCAITKQNGKETMLSPNDVVSGPKHQQVPMIKTSNQMASSSPQNSVAITENITRTPQKQSEIVSTPKNVVPQTLKMELEHEDSYSPPSSPTCSDTDEERPEVHKKVPASTKLANKAPTPKLGRKGSLPTSLSSSSVSGNSIGKLTRNTPRLARSVLRNRTFVKKKIQESTPAACNNKGDNDLNPSASELVCQKCGCNLKDTSKEKDEDTRTSTCAEVSSSNVNSGASKAGLDSSSCNDGDSVTTVTPETKKSKSREKGEFLHSSKSSGGGEHSSSSTSISDESNLSGSGCGNRPHMSKDVRWEAIRHTRMQHGVLDLNHFNLLKKLGCGDIGSVYLAELIGTNCLFAIKVMDNEFLAKRKKMARAQTEREILGMLDHPFLPTLYAQFTTDNLSCLVMEYCPGGDLHVLRQKQPDRNYSEQAARFYVAEVLLALEYLHMLGVVYRDLKPENILVREDGHIMLTDFDLSLRCSVNPTLIKSSSFNTDPAKVSGPCASANCIQPLCNQAPCQTQCFSPRFLPASAKSKARKLKADLAAQRRSLPQLVAEPTDARSNSFVGTHEYLAPEIIKGGGHGAAVDWWTFGIFLYELLYGRTPFKGRGNEETLTNVVLNGLRFPEDPIVSLHARDLIRKLLVKDPENRLGAEKGAAEIKQHPFFEGLNWALIRCAVPPDLPHIGPPHPHPHDTVSESDDGESKYLECKATGEHLEFESF